MMSKQEILVCHDHLRWEDEKLRKMYDLHRYYGVQDEIVIFVKSFNNLIDECNYTTIKQMKAIKEVEIKRWSDDSDTVMYIALIIDRTADSKYISGVEEALCAIENYPILDDHLYSERELSIIDQFLDDKVDTDTEEEIREYIRSNLHHFKDSVDLTVGNMDSGGDYIIDGFDENKFDGFVNRYCNIFATNWIIENENDYEENLTHILERADDNVSEKVIDNLGYHEEANLGLLLNRSNLSESEIFDILNKLDSDGRNLIKRLAREI
jgi:hypothetical protein